MGVVATMTVPYSTIEFVLREFATVRWVLNFIDTIAPKWELNHLLSFGALGFVARFAWRDARVWQVALGVLAVGALVEILQIWIPGRHAAVSHAVLDLAGGLLGLGVAWLFGYAWGAESLPRFQHSTHWVGPNSRH